MNFWIAEHTHWQYPLKRVRSNTSKMLPPLTRMQYRTRSTSQTAEVRTRKTPTRSENLKQSRADETVKEDFLYKKYIIIMY